MVIVITRKKIIIALLLFALATAFGAWLSYGRSHNAYSQIVPEEKDYVILIHVDEKRLYLLENGEVIKKYIISTGKTGFPSPIGDWMITNKGTNWGGGFGARWLGLNVTWGVYGIHGTNDEGRIGYAVSHGCIRMRNRDVAELYKLVGIGTPVIIRNGPYGPFGMGFKVLLPGQRGADVLAVQKRLKDLGYYEGNESGIYNDSLKAAVHQFQRDHDMPVKDKITHDDYAAMGFVEFD